MTNNHARKGRQNRKTFNARLDLSTIAKIRALIEYLSHKSQGVLIDEIINVKAESIDFYLNCFCCKQLIHISKLGSLTEDKENYLCKNCTRMNNDELPPAV